MRGENTGNKMGKKRGENERKRKRKKKKKKKKDRGGKSRVGRFWDPNSVRSGRWFV